MSEAALEPLLDTLKRAAAALEAEHVPYLLGGGLGSWARGGPPSSNDIDLMVKREDSERALEALRQTGMRTERPPERRLFKAWDGPTLIDREGPARAGRLARAARALLLEPLRAGVPRPRRGAGRRARPGRVAEREQPVARPRFAAGASG